MDNHNDIAMAMAFPFPIFGNSGLSVHQSQKPKKQELVKEAQDEGIILDNDRSSEHEVPTPEAKEKEDEEATFEEQEDIQLNNEKEDIVFGLNEHKDGQFIPHSRKRADSGISLISEGSDSMDLGINKLNLNQPDDVNNDNKSLLDKAINLLGLIANGKGYKNQKEEISQDNEVSTIYNTLLDLQDSMVPKDVNEIVDSPTAKSSSETNTSLNEEETDEANSMEEIQGTVNQIQQSNNTSMIHEEDFKQLFDDMASNQSEDIQLLESEGWTKAKEYVESYFGERIENLNLRDWLSNLDRGALMTIPFVISFTLAVFFMNLSKRTLKSFTRR